MGTKTSCKYCDKVIEETKRIEVHIEGGIDEEHSILLLWIDLCSKECLRKVFDLGSQVLDFGCTPEKPYKELIEEEKSG